MSVFLRHIFKEDQRWRMVIEDWRLLGLDIIRLKGLEVVWPIGANGSKSKFDFEKPPDSVSPTRAQKIFLILTNVSFKCQIGFFLVPHQFISHLIIGQSTGDFVSGFARQSLLLTWGTGPRWLRHLLLIFNFRFARVKNKPKVPHLFA